MADRSNTSTKVTSSSTSQPTHNNNAIEAENLAKFQQSMVSAISTIHAQCSKFRIAVDTTIKNLQYKLPDVQQQQILLIKTVIDGGESIMVDELNKATSTLTQIYRFILNSNYAKADSNREQFGLVLDIGKGKITPNHVISYNSETHFGSEGSQQPGHLNPFHIEDQVAIGSIEKMK